MTSDKPSLLICRKSNRFHSLRKNGSIAENLVKQRLGKKAAKTKTIRPITNTLMVFELQPFHSFRIIPHTLLNTTLSAIRIQNDNVVRASEEVRKPFPIDSPKN